ncbi:MAG: heme-dependent peroxidase [Bryobacteraceae bacterium]|nr:heme-dependent peroxidase [Bryobacteraceae bacterium]MDW8379425.1 hydrogen peroxide-dependent heme synthase [Bryobacterales bacterium]
MERMKLPPVPLTLEGASVLHQMVRVQWSALRKVSPDEQMVIAQEAQAVFADASLSAMYALLGHKGDLMFLHFRKDFEQLAQVQLDLSHLRLMDYCEVVNSYLSVVELGLYESTAKTYQALAERGIEPHTPAWQQGVEEVLSRQRQAMAPRLYPPIPANRYVCFYPMDRRRGEQKNWYMEPMSERARMMHEHGLVGRRYADQVKQIISGSIGFDDWEWGVDLFADEPLVFKKLIYEMRFDEVSAMYASFGPFFVGLRFPSEDLGAYLQGKLPALRG